MRRIEIKLKSITKTGENVQKRIIYFDIIKYTKEHIKFYEYYDRGQDKTKFFETEVHHIQDVESFIMK